MPSQPQLQRNPTKPSTTEQASQQAHHPNDQADAAKDKHADQQQATRVRLFSHGFTFRRSA
jgi:hypothetical protein